MQQLLGDGYTHKAADRRAYAKKSRLTSEQRDYQYMTERRQYVEAQSIKQKRDRQLKKAYPLVDQFNTPHRAMAHLRNIRRNIVDEINYFVNIIYCINTEQPLDAIHALALDAHASIEYLRSELHKHDQYLYDLRRLLEKSSPTSKAFLIREWPYSGFGSDIYYFKKRVPLVQTFLIPPEKLLNTVNQQISPSNTLQYPV